MGDALNFNLTSRSRPPGADPAAPQALPPQCTTGFLPAQQRRVPTFEDYRTGPPGNVYCRVPQDAPFNVRGARNLRASKGPAKRAPTWQECESDEVYVPLNDGYNWNGDPNATASGRPCPTFRRTSHPPELLRRKPAPPPIAAPNTIRQAAVRRTGRTCLHTVQSGQRCRRGEDMADDAPPPRRGKLTETAPDTSVEPTHTDSGRHRRRRTLTRTRSSPILDDADEVAARGRRGNRGPR